MKFVVAFIVFAISIKWIEWLLVPFIGFNWTTVGMFFALQLYSCSHALSAKAARPWRDRVRRKLDDDYKKRKGI